jgi:hypothetical protein
MKLVVDNDSNVEPLPVGNLMDIAGMARIFAEDIDTGKWGDATRALVIIQNDTGLTVLGWGENTSAYEMMGIFEAAKLRVFADDAIED